MVPFWLQNERRHRRLRRKYSPDVICVGCLIIVLFVISLVLIIVAMINSFLSFISPFLSFISSILSFLSSFLSSTSRILEPESVKKSWDALNIVLVLFAVICAFLSKNNDDNETNFETPYHFGDDEHVDSPSPPPPPVSLRPPNETRISYEDYNFPSTVNDHVVDDDDDEDEGVRRSNPSIPGQRYYDQPSSSDQKSYNSLRGTRSGRSDPDLRHESTTTINGDDRWSFNDDDIDLSNSRSRSTRGRDEEQVHSSNLNDVAVDAIHSTTLQTAPNPSHLVGEDHVRRSTTPSNPSRWDHDQSSSSYRTANSSFSSSTSYPDLHEDAGLYDSSSSSYPGHVYDHVRRSFPSNPSQLYSDQRTADNSLRRSRSNRSCPDLQRESSRTMNGDDRWRSNDDTELCNFRSRSRRDHDEEQVYSDHLKNIAVDSVTVHNMLPLQPTPPPVSLPDHVVDDDNVRRSSPSNSGQRYHDQLSSSDRKTYNSLRRSRSNRSSPDLRQDSSWPMDGDHDWWRFNDDTSLYDFRSRSMRERDEEQQDYFDHLKDTAVDNVRSRSLPEPSAPSLPDSPWVYEYFQTKEAVKSELETKTLPPPHPASLPLSVVVATEPSAAPLLHQSPPPHSLPRAGSENRNRKRKKRGRTQVAIDFIVSLARNKKKKKKKPRQRSVENFDERPSYPPPVLPPQPQSLEARASEREPNKPPTTIHKPPLPVKNVENSVESSSQSSSLNATLLPPPHPPFRVPSPEYEQIGDFVRLKSISRWNWSPDNRLSGEASSSNTGDVDGGKSMAEPLSHPSPDVNIKADKFIATLVALWMLEKKISERRRSNPDLDPGPSSM